MATRDYYFIRDSVEDCDWMLKGACKKDQDVDYNGRTIHVPAGSTRVFFPGQHDIRNLSLAKAICMQECPVQIACLEYALRRNDDLCGVWGGTSERERRRMRRQRRVS